MKKMIKIIRKVDLERSYLTALKIELDYLLLSLHEAVQQNDSKQRESIVQRLKEIQEDIVELEGKK